MFTGQSDGVAPLNGGGVARGIGAEQITKSGGGKLIADPFMINEEFRFPWCEHPALLESDRAEAIETDDAGVQGTTVSGLVGCPGLFFLS